MNHFHRSTDGFDFTQTNPEQLREMLRNAVEKLIANKMGASEAYLGARSAIVRISRKLNGDASHSQGRARIQR